jgi:excisionase family DNA binding protein
MSAPRFHSPKEASDLLGISKRTLRRAVEMGELSCIKYNSRTWRFSAVDLAAWYASRGGRLATSKTTVATSPPA